MLLTISTTHKPATDLGYLLHKHPVRFQTFSASFGKVYIYFPVAQTDRCSAVMQLDIDPIGLIRGRGKKRHDTFSLGHYVNDRPYVASSLLSAAISKFYGTALSGRCRDKPELAQTPIPLEASIVSMPDSSGGELIRRLFEPLGYKVGLKGYPLDEQFPEWGQSDYFKVDLQGTVRLSELLTHLYVLIPVSDNRKHYYVGDAEVEKLIEKGEGWLANHPEKELITGRYLKYQRGLTQAALGRLLADENLDIDTQESSRAEEEETIEKRLSLNQQRLNQVLTELKTSGSKRVLDLGCGEGRLLKLLMNEKQFDEIVGLDVSYRTLEKAKKRLHFDELPLHQQERVNLWHGSLVYRDSRLSGFDAAAVVEVIEHLDSDRLISFERVIFEHARPRTVVITTPNRDYNENFETLPAGDFRHKDHRFEWTRDEFHTWANSIKDRFGYTVKILPVGPEDVNLGAPTQMGVFSL